MCFLGQEIDNSGPGSLLCATGSDDTVVRVIRIPLAGRIADSPSTPDVIATCQGHLSSVRSLARSLLTKNVFYSAGGRGQLLRWRAADGFSNSHVVSDAVFAPFPVVRKKWSDQDLLEPDTRVMSIDACALRGREFIAAGSSDGDVSVFESELGPAGTLRRIGSIASLASCILHVRFAQLSDKYFVISCGTDGRITIMRWCLSERQNESDNELSAVIVFTAHSHQSGVDALDVKCHDGQLMIVSGGDDTAINFLLFTDAKNVHQFGKPAAHYAQITGP